MILTSLIFPFERTYRIKDIKGLNEGVRKLVTFVSKRHDESCQVLFGPLVPLQLCFKVIKHIFTGLWSCHFSGITFYVYTFSGVFYGAVLGPLPQQAQVQHFRQKMIYGRMHQTFSRYVHMARDEYLTGWKFVRLGVPFTRNHLTLRKFRCPVVQSSMWTKRKYWTVPRELKLPTYPSPKLTLTLTSY